MDKKPDLPIPTDGAVPTLFDMAPAGTKSELLLQHLTPHQLQSGERTPSGGFHRTSTKVYGAARQDQRGGGDVAGHPTAEVHSAGAARSESESPSTSALGDAPPTPVGASTTYASSTESGEPEQDSTEKRPEPALTPPPAFISTPLPDAEQMARIQHRFMLTYMERQTISERLFIITIAVIIILPVLCIVTYWLLFT